MATKRMLLELGMGTDIRGGDPTKAAVRALKDALWHNSLSITKALGLDYDAMHVVVTIASPHPQHIDQQAVLAVLPHGSGEVKVVAGGLEIPTDDGDDVTLIAHAAAEVYIDLGNH